MTAWSVGTPRRPAARRTAVISARFAADVRTEPRRALGAVVIPGPPFCATHRARADRRRNTAGSLSSPTAWPERSHSPGQPPATVTLLVLGGATLVQEYIRAGLVDEVRVQLVPVCRGTGARLSRISAPSTSSWQHRRHRLVSRHTSAVRPGWLLTSGGASASRGRGGVASGSAASCSSASMLSSAAVLFSRRRPQWVHRWINTQRRSPRTVTAIGSIPPGQPDFRSPGTLRSRCLDHRQRGQWLRWVVPGASSETSTPQCPQRNERRKGKTGDLSERHVRTGKTSLASSPVWVCGRTKSERRRAGQPEFTGNRTRSEGALHSGHPPGVV
jgi:dihydrofolate reductase